MSIETIVYEPLVSEFASRVREYAASAAITPGMLIEVAAAGTVAAHGTAQGSAQRLFAIENLGNAGVVDTAYATGDNTHTYAATNGDRIYALVSAGTAAIAAGDLLASDGAGGVITATGAAGNSKLIGRALEAVDNSGGGTAVRIKLEVL